MSRTHVPAVLRRRVYQRAGGRCEYCLTPEDVCLVHHEVDHVIAQKHGGPTELGNLALSCAVCNKHKGTDVASVDPESGQIVPLFNPRSDAWRAHFSLDGPRLVALMPNARATVNLLQLNRQDRFQERELLAAAGLLHSPD